MGIDRLVEIGSSSAAKGPAFMSQLLLKPLQAQQVRRHCLLREAIVKSVGLSLVFGSVFWFVVLSFAFLVFGERSWAQLAYSAMFLLPILFVGWVGVSLCRLRNWARITVIVLLIVGPFAAVAAVLRQGNDEFLSALLMPLPGAAYALWATAGELPAHVCSTYYRDTIRNSPDISSDGRTLGLAVLAIVSFALIGCLLGAAIQWLSS